MRPKPLKIIESKEAEDLELRHILASETRDNEPEKMHELITASTVKTYLLLKWNLRDIYDANLTWLKEAIMSYDSSIEHRGIMTHENPLDENDDSLGFYQCLLRAIDTWRRHELTDYEGQAVSSISEKWLATTLSITYLD